MARNVHDIIKLIIKGNRTDALGDPDVTIEEILKLTHVRLDRASLSVIPKLDFLPLLTNLYLQHNCITEMENLSYMTGLRFLMLANNKLTAIGNVRALVKLQLLDVSCNLIKSVDFEEMPESVTFLNLSDNPCMSEDRRITHRAQARLKNLKVFNGSPVETEESSDEDDGSSSCDPAMATSVEKIPDPTVQRGEPHAEDLLLKIEHDVENAVGDLSLAVQQVQQKLDRDSELYKLQVGACNMDLMMPSADMLTTSRLSSVDTAVSESPSVGYQRGRTRAAACQKGAATGMPMPPQRPNVKPTSANFGPRKRNAPRTKEGCIRTRIRTPGALPFKRGIE